MNPVPVEIRFSYQLTKKPGKYIKRGRKLVPYVPSKTAIAKRLGKKRRETQTGAGGHHKA